MKKIIVTIIFMVVCASAQYLPFALKFGDDLEIISKTLGVEPDSVDLEDGTSLYTLNKSLGSYEVNNVVCLFHEKKLYRIALLFEERSFHLCKSMYDNLSESLSKKYKKIKSENLFFEPYYYGDGYEFQAIRNKKGFVYTTFVANYNELEYSVEISIAEGYVRILYTDTKMFSEKQKKDQEKLEGSL